jgi:TPR repeat protein
VEQYRLAMEGGCAAANESLALGLCFEKGRGMPHSNPTEALRLYALAAEGCTSGEEVVGVGMTVRAAGPTPRA